MEVFDTIDGKNIYVIRDEMGNILVSDELMREMIHHCKVVRKMEKNCGNCFTKQCKGCVWDSKARQSTKWNVGELH